MPSITTHHFFSKDVYNKLNQDEQNKIIKDLTIFHTFAQSHDYLFYYTFSFKNASKIKNLGHYAHHNSTQDYLINIVKNIKENKLENNSQALAYLYGSITHYCLDTTCHPFIFYKTGVYRSYDPKTHKFHGEHTHMEKDIDAILYKRNTNKSYNHCKINKEIIKKPLFSPELINLISATYKETYNEDNIGEYYYQGIKHAKIINNIIFQDFFGIKRFFYILIDKITNNAFGSLESYSNHLLKPNINFLNNEHKLWNNPAKQDLTYNYSFDDLYKISLKKSLKIIRACNKVLFDKADIKTLKKFIPNIDYSTGLPIEDDLRMEHFEY